MPSKKKKYNARFPPARIKKIMQTDEEVGKVAATVPVIISRALELFIESMIKQSTETTLSKNAKTLSASHIKQTIESEERYKFLRELVAGIPDHQAEEEASTTQNNPEQSPVKRHRGRPRKSKDGVATTPKTDRRRRKRESSSESSEGENSEETDDADEDNDEEPAPSTSMDPHSSNGNPTAQTTTDDPHRIPAAPDSRPPTSTLSDPPPLTQLLAAQAHMAHSHHHPLDPRLPNMLPAAMPMYHSMPGAGQHFFDWQAAMMAPGFPASAPPRPLPFPPGHPPLDPSAPVPSPLMGYPGLGVMSGRYPHFVPRLPDASWLGFHSVPSPYPPGMPVASGSASQADDDYDS